MLLNRLSLKAKFVLAIAIPCILLLFVGVSSLQTMTFMHSVSGKLYFSTAAPIRSMAEVASRIPRMRVGIDMMLLQETALRDKKGVLTRVKETYEEDIPEMRTAMEYAVKIQVDPPGRDHTLLTKFD